MRRVAHPVTVEAQRDPLPFALWEAALGGGIEQEGLRGAGKIVAAIALFAGGGLAAFDHVFALTIETSHRDEGRRTPFQEKQDLRLALTYVRKIPDKLRNIGDLQPLSVSPEKESLRHTSARQVQI